MTPHWGFLVGRAANNTATVPFAELVTAKLRERGYGQEATELILGEYGEWAGRRPLLTEKDALGELVLAEMANLARRKRGGQDG